MNSQFKRMQKLAGIVISENSTSTYEYGCMMLYFDFPEMENIHSKISSEDVYEEEGDRTFGLEDEPHCTLLFGLHDNELDQDEVINATKQFKYPEVTAHNASLFENEKYDVLKFDIKGDSLHEANAALREFPYSNDYPDYHPHMTVGYLKPGTGKKYAEMLKDQKFTLTPQYAIYSHPDGSKDKIEIENE